METRRMASVIVSLAAVVVVLSGCDRGNAADSPGATFSQPSMTATSQETSAGALHNGAALVARSSFRLTFKDADSTTTASIDPQAKNASMRSEDVNSSGSRSSTEMIQIGSR